MHYSIQQRHRHRRDDVVSPIPSQPLYTGVTPRWIDANRTSQFVLTMCVCVCVYMRYCYTPSPCCASFFRYVCSPIERCSVVLATLMPAGEGGGVEQWLTRTQSASRPPERHRAGQLRSRRPLGYDHWQTEQPKGFRSWLNYAIQ